VGAIDGTDPWWVGLFVQSSTVVGPFLLYFGYPLVPWTGLMLLGFGTAAIFQQDTVRRDRTLLWAGVSMIVAFLVLRSLDLYGDPNPWQWQEAGLQATVLDFMNVSKYPPSLLFLLIPLGPMAILCAFADRWSGWLKDTLVMFGRVPFAFYIAHWYLLRVSADWVSLRLAESANSSFLLTIECTRSNPLECALSQGAAPTRIIPTTPCHRPG